MASYKETVRAAILEQAHAKNLCDARDAAFCATADELPDGSFGIVLLALNGNTLNICDIDLRNNIGGILCAVPMAEVQNYKIGRSLFANTLGFTWNGHKFFFKNMAGVKELLELIGSEAGK